MSITENFYKWENYFYFPFISILILKSKLRWYSYEKKLRLVCLSPSALCYILNKAALGGRAMICCCTPFHVCLEGKKTSQKDQMGKKDKLKTILQAI